MTHAQYYYYYQKVFTKFLNGTNLIKEAVQMLELECPKQDSSKFLPSRKL